MTSIANGQSIISPTTQQLRLDVGHETSAEVIGSTRRGAILSIGQDFFHFKLPTELATAKALTLQRTATASGALTQLSIVAADGVRLKQPLVAESADISQPQLSSRRSQHLSVDPMVQTRGVDVAARLLSSNGQAAGPVVSLRLLPIVSTANSISTGTNESIDRPVELTNPSRGSTSPSSQIERSQSVFETTGLRDPVRPDNASGVGRGAGSSFAGADHDQIKASMLQAAAKGQNHLEGQHTQRRKGNMSLGLIDPKATSLDPNAQAASDPRQQRAPMASIGQVQLATAQPSLTELTTEQRSGMTAAIVAGRASDGKLLIQTADHFFKVEEAIDLPVGITLQISLAGGSETSLTRFQPPQNADPLTLLDGLIRLLGDIDRTATLTSPSDELVHNRQLPSANKYLGQALLSLLAGASGQDFSNGMDQAEYDGVSSGTKDRVHGLVRELGMFVSEPLADGWRGIGLPVGPDSAQAVFMYYRDYIFDDREEASENDTEAAGMQRAVFDVVFSRLGRCQIDVLYQHQRFDLLLRSEHPLPEGTRQDIAVAFESACDIAGISGEIGFRLGGFWEPARVSTAKRDLKT